MWTEAASVLADLLTSNAEAVREGRALLERGATVATAIGTITTTERYLAMNSALESFQEARYRLRSMLVGAALAEGLTAEQLVETLAVPPGLAGRILAEFRPSDPQPGPDTGPASAPRSARP